MRSRLVLPSLLFGLGTAAPAAAGEVSRASPVVATIAARPSIVQGTVVAPSAGRTSLATHGSVATWRFPYLAGHLRARVASSVTAAATSFASGQLAFDAADRIPSPSYTGCTLPVHGACRYVFTSDDRAAASGGPSLPAPIVLADATATAIGHAIAPPAAYPTITAQDDRAIVRAILDAPLGGVDRSTVAVIEASERAGDPERPTIAYFGAADGMVHAVCASIGGNTESQHGVCPSLGTELWAFLPRTQLPLVRTNQQRVDGSPHVVDAFGEFAASGALGGSGASGASSASGGSRHRDRSWHTILTFQTGSSPAAYAIDVTDPASPVVLWEHAATTTPAAVDFGVGLTTAPGTAVIDGNLANIVVLATNNGGSGGAGVVATALALETGAQLWQFGELYPASAGVPASGIPGGAVGVDLDDAGFFTDIVLGDLYGRLWRLDAASGASRTGAATPLFAFAYNPGTDKHPIGALPAIYRDDRAQYAVIATGGYADPSDTSWRAGRQFVAVVRIAATVALHADSRVCAGCGVRRLQALADGDRAFAQPLVVGAQLFITSDAADVNAASYGAPATPTGHVLELIGLDALVTAIAPSGAGSLATAGGALYASAGRVQQQLRTADTGGATGGSTEVAATP